MRNNSTEKIVSLIFSASRNLKQKLDLSNPLFQMPLAHTETLRLIHEKKQVAMKQVAGFLAITPPSATALVNHLVGAGYVARNSDKQDRRSVHLKLTKKGEGVMRQSQTEHCRIFTGLLKKLSLKEQLELLNILTKLNN
jgi:MarR family 2-MHQ and catechol resistance regulon transcriptional repressor